MTRATETDALPNAPQDDPDRRTAAVPLRDRLRPLLARVAAAAPTGLAADKAFYDGLEEEP